MLDETARQALQNAKRNKAFAHDLNHKNAIMHALSDIYADEVSDISDPEEVFTGVGMVSIVYLITAKIDGRDKKLIAKIELNPDSDRFEREIAATNALKNDYGIKSGFFNNIFLPEGYCETKIDGCEIKVIVYEAAHQHAFTQNIIELGQLLELQIENVDNCVKAIDRLAEILIGVQVFYSDDLALTDSLDGRWIRWGDAFSIKDGYKDALVKEAGFCLELVDYGESDELHIEGMDLPSPINPIEKMLAERTLRLATSRIHGDLNISNILCTLSTDWKPEAIFLIDMSHSAPKAISAVDFARVEIDLWGQLFPSLCGTELREHFQFTILRYLAGEVDALPGKLPGKIVAFVRIVSRWRQKSSEFLGVVQPYLFYDYNHCLYFYHLKQLYYGGDSPDRQDLEIENKKSQLKIHLLGAAFALRFITRIKAGFYTSDLRTTMNSNLAFGATQTSDADAAIVLESSEIVSEVAEFGDDDIALQTSRQNLLANIGKLILSGVSQEKVEQIRQLFIAHYNNGLFLDLTLTDSTIRAHIQEIDDMYQELTALSLDSTSDDTKGELASALEIGAHNLRSSLRHRLRLKKDKHVH